MNARSSFQNQAQPPTLRERRAELTRTAILDAARRLFARQGFAATPVRPIAEEAGVSVQTLYTTFGSKQGLLLALVDTVRDQSGAQELGRGFAETDDPREMTRLAARIRRLILERAGDIVATFREGAAGDADVAAAYDEGRRRSHEGVGRMVARIQQVGALREGLTAQRAVDQVVALFATETYEELTGELSGWTPDEYEEWLADRIADAILR